MRWERKEHGIISSKPYSISEYDISYIVLKGYNESLKGKIFWSEKKQKYFLKGKIIHWQVMADDGQRVIRSYPLEGSIAFIHCRQLHMFNACKYLKAKEELVMHIHYSWIDLIILDFDGGLKK
jgi:hypothetical protein